MQNNLLINTLKKLLSAVLLSQNNFGNFLLKNLAKQQMNLVALLMREKMVKK